MHGSTAGKLQAEHTLGMLDILSWGFCIGLISELKLFFTGAVSSRCAGSALSGSPLFSPRWEKELENAFHFNSSFLCSKETLSK